MSAQQALLSPDRLAHDELARDCFQDEACSGAETLTGDLSRLRLVPVPDTGPPFDLDPHAGAVATAAAPGELAGADRAADTTASGPWQANAQGRSSQLAAASTELIGIRPTAGIARWEASGEWAEQFARLLAEVLAGARPVRQILPWTSERARVHLHRLTPLFSCEQQPRVLRVIVSRPVRDVIEMTVIVGVGTRTRALAVRLEQATQRQRPSWASPARRSQQAGITPRWVCTDIESA